LPGFNQLVVELGRRGLGLPLPVPTRNRMRIDVLFLLPVAATLMAWLSSNGARERVNQCAAAIGAVAAGDFVFLPPPSPVGRANNENGTQYTHSPHEERLPDIVIARLYTQQTLSLA